LHNMWDLADNLSRRRVYSKLRKLRFCHDAEAKVYFLSV
jgi:hypothetical protein